MSSITTYRKGALRRIQFFDGARRRRSIRLNNVSAERAEEIQGYVDALNAAAISGLPWKPPVARWVGRQDVELYDKLAAVDLVPKRDADGETLATFVDSYIASRTDWKPETRRLSVDVRNNLVGFFGADRVLKTITPYDADEFRRHLRETKALSTSNKICGRAKSMFRAAVRKRLLPESPFGDMSHLAIRSAKKFTVTREMADKVLEACIDNQWRLIFALCRFGGLRCPSEVLKLRWGDINWEQGRFVVHSPKTEHHEGRESRIVPLFPELLPHLEAVWDEAPDGAEFVITRYRKTNSNLRTQLERIIVNAGLKPWPVLFNSLRATRETELNDRFPEHVVCAWLGNSPRIARKHYLTVTDAHFDAASESPQPERTERPDTENCTAAPKSCTEAVHSPVYGAPYRLIGSPESDEIIEKRATSRKTRARKTPPVGLEPTT